MWSFRSTCSCPPYSVSSLERSPLIAGFVAKQRIELDPGHIGLRDVGDVTSAALADRRLRRRLLVWQWMVAKRVEPPAIGLGESLAVLHRHVDSIELAVEEPASGWLLARTVWKRRVEDACELFHENGSFGKRSGFQIRVDVLLLHVDVVIFRKSRHAVVEAVGRQRSADEHPLAEAGRQFDFSVRQKDRGRTLSLGGNRCGGARPEAGKNQPDSTDGEQVLVH